jgi:hypothetical protein
MSSAKQKANIWNGKPMSGEFQYFIKIAYLIMVNQ